MKISVLTFLALLNYQLLLGQSEAHKEQIKKQLSRSPKKLPTMNINPNVKNIFDFTYEDFELLNYEPHPLIKGKVAI